MGRLNGGGPHRAHGGATRGPNPSATTLGGTPRRPEACRPNGVSDLGRRAIAGRPNQRLSGAAYAALLHGGRRAWQAATALGRPAGGGPAPQGCGSAQACAVEAHSRAGAMLRGGARRANRAPDGRTDRARTRAGPIPNAAVAKLHRARAQLTQSTIESFHAQKLLADPAGRMPQADFLQRYVQPMEVA